MKSIDANKKRSAQIAPNSFSSSSSRVMSDAPSPQSVVVVPAAKGTPKWSVRARYTRKQVASRLSLPRDARSANCKARYCYHKLSACNVEVPWAYTSLKVITRLSLGSSLLGATTSAI